MSDGTRDQLYLALRLATLEWRMETSEPMPFVVDDILIFSDNEPVESAAIKKYLITATDGKNYNTKHYNLSAIIAVG